MSVIGIDFGNESCYVAAAKAGGIETLANDYSLRATPSCVAFDGKKRIIGVAAKNQQVTNMKNTVNGFKRLLGRRFNDPHVQRELSNIPVKVEQRQDGGVGVRVNYLDKEQSFTPEQLTAMLFTKLKETSINALQAQVNDCVIACPVYFTNAERMALLDAAQIAGLNVLRLMNETTATALSYGFYKPDLPDDKPRTVIFVDCGHASLQVSACAFNKGKLRMLASTWDQIGGRDFDNVLAEHFAKEFAERYKINAKTNARAMLRLLTEIEKLKKQMSANSTKLPLNIECFMDDIDVSSSMQRCQMEELCAPLLQRVEHTFHQLLHQSKLHANDIHSVEIVGGTTRIPAIKSLIEQVFGKPASTTLNTDESVSRGAALQCAIMSPAVRVREFGVTDIQNYPVKVSWESDSHLQGGEIEVFPAFHPAPFSRLLTLNRKEPFTMTVQYASQVPFTDPIIGKWHIKDVKPGDRGEYQEVKIKVRINNHGIVLISSASLLDRKELEEAQVTSSEQAAAASSEDSSKQAGAGEQPQQSGENMEVGQEEFYENEDVARNTSTASSPGGQGWAQRVMGWFSSGEKKRKQAKMIELPMDSKTHGFLPAELNNLIQHEARMVASDAKETERIDAKNALEEFVYDMRNKLQDGPLTRYVLEKDRNQICDELNEIENWLYEDGEDCDRDVYVNKLNSLQQRTEPIRERAHDFENCPKAFDDLKQSINYGRHVYNEYKNGAPKFEHLTEAEFLNISEATDKAQRWLDSKISSFAQASRTNESPVKLGDVLQEIRHLNNLINNVVNRPKPKPAAANAKGTEKTSSAGSDKQNGGMDDSHNQQSSPPKAQNSNDNTMDIE